jgi:hypothetical protein
MRSSSKALRASVRCTALASVAPLIHHRPPVRCISQARRQSQPSTTSLAEQSGSESHMLIARPPHSSHASPRPAAARTAISATCRQSTRSASTSSHSCATPTQCHRRRKRLSCSPLSRAPRRSRRHPRSHRAPPRRQSRRKAARCRLHHHHFHRSQCSPLCAETTLRR